MCHRVKKKATTTKREWERKFNGSDWFHDFFFFLVLRWEWVGFKSWWQHYFHFKSRVTGHEKKSTTISKHTSVTSCWTFWWEDKVGWPQHHTSCTLEWIVKADRKAGESNRLWTAARSASTPCPAWPFFFNCCWTRWRAAVTSCKPLEKKNNYWNGRSQKQLKK